MNMIKANINGMPVVAKKGTTILDAASKVNIKIPALCKHPDLHASGACGICVVRIKNYNNKFLRACTTPLEEGMDIVTHDPEIISVRRNILELILSFHPNECLTCGRNGSCELQELTSEFGIRNVRYEQYIEDADRDYSTKTLVFDASKCIKCGRCIDVCQRLQNVWALTFLERGHNIKMRPAGDISLAESPCVRCGQCSAHCPVGAIYEYDETAAVYNALCDEEKYPVVQIAPAVRVAIGDAFGLKPGTNLSGKIYSVCRKLGFKAVFDTNFGADVTIMEEASEFVKKYTGKPEELPLITTCCPSWVDFMEKKHHDMIPHFSSCKSPMAINGVLTKTYFAEQKKIDPAKIFNVAVMPCTSKKFEIIRNKDMYASSYQDVDVSITTREFVRMIKQSGIDFINLPEESADHILGAYSGAGTIFGASGGVMEAALRTAHYLITGENLADVNFTQVRGTDGVREAEIDIAGNKVKVAIAHGLGNVETVLDKIRTAKEKGKRPPYDFIEVMACPGGCVSGGGQPFGINSHIREERAKGLYEDDENQKLIRCSHDNPYIKKLYDQFLGEPASKTAHKLLHTSYSPNKEYIK